MARRSSNRTRNARTVELMELQPDSRVLEIGCGPGLAIARCAAKVTSGRIVAIDHSPIMIDQAQKRLAKAGLTAGAELHVGGIEHLTDWPVAFDRVYSLNVIQFIADKRDYYRKVFDALDIGGQCFTTYQPRLDNDAPNAAERMADEIETMMNSAGFQEVIRNAFSAGTAPAVCVSGVKGTHVADEAWVFFLNCRRTCTCQCAHGLQPDHPNTGERRQVETRLVLRLIPHRKFDIHNLFTDLSEIRNERVLFQEGRAPEIDLHLLQIIKRNTCQPGILSFGNPVGNNSIANACFHQGHHAGASRGGCCDFRRVSEGRCEEIVSAGPDGLAGFIGDERFVSKSADIIGSIQVVVPVRGVYQRQPVFAQ